MESPMPPTPWELPELPPLPSPLSLVDMLVLADMSPTLPELSMLPRDPLMLSQRLRLMPLSSTELTDMVDTVLAMPDTDLELTHMPMVDMDTHMPTELTTERDLLMLRLMLMLLSSMELLDMVDMVLDMPVTDMELTHMPLDTLMVVTHMPMELTTERDPLMLSQKLMPLTCMELMDMEDMVLDMPDTDMDTHMPMEDMDTHMLMESKL